MLKDVIYLACLNTYFNSASVFSLARNNRVSRFSFPAEKAMWACASNNFSVVGNIHRNGCTNCGWPHYIDTPLAWVFYNLGLVGKTHKLLC